MAGKPNGVNSDFTTVSHAKWCMYCTTFFSLQDCNPNKSGHQAAPSPKIEPTRRLRDRFKTRARCRAARARESDRAPRSLHFPRLPIARRAEEGQQPGPRRGEVSPSPYSTNFEPAISICVWLLQLGVHRIPTPFLPDRSCSLPLRWFLLYVRRTTSVVAATPMAWAQEQRIEEHFGRFLCFDEDSERYHNPSRIKLELCRCSVSVSLHRYLLWIFCEIDRTRKRFRDSQSDFIVYAISPNGL